MSAGHLTLAGNRARFADGRNRIGGIHIVGGAVVVHGHGLSIPRTAQVRDGCGCLADCRNGSKVVVGSTWRLNLNNPSVRPTKQPRVQWEPFECSNRFRTVSNTNVRKFAASNPASAGIGLHGFTIGYNFLKTFSRMSETRIRRGFERPRKGSEKPYPSATLPSHGLLVDALAVRLCDRRGENLGMHLLRVAEGRGRRESSYYLPSSALLRDPEHLPLHARPRDDRALCAPGRATQVASRGSSGNDGPFSEDGGGFTGSLPARWGESRNEHRKGRRGGRSGAHPYACLAPLGGGRELRERDRRDPHAAGDTRCDLEED